MQKKIAPSVFEIVDYKNQYKTAFKTLNEEWIAAYFTLEEEDRKLLDRPEETILTPGGFILIALYEGKAVGSCAMIPMEDPNYDFELGKMAVAPVLRGNGLGALLAQAALAKAKILGAKKVYLESNTILAPAIHLYRKLGFYEITDHQSPYQRCNIQMAIDLTLI